MLSFVQVPEHGLTVFATRSAERTVRRDSDSVEVSAMTDVVGFELAVCQVPDLNLVVPASRNDDGVGSIGAEANS